MIKIKNLRLDLRGHKTTKTILQGIDIDIARNAITALVGMSGSGKSLSALSIARLFSNNFSPSGEIIFEGKNLLDLDEKHLQDIRGKDIGFIFQDPLNSLNPLHKIGKQILEIITTHNIIGKQEGTKRVQDLLQKVGLSKSQSLKYPHELSGGERQRVMIAIALANNPKLLIADEPTTSLDLNIGKQILDLIKSLCDDISVLFITHDLGLVRHYADFVYVMKEGKIVEHAHTQELFNSPKQDYTKELIASKPKDFSPPFSSDEILLEASDLSVRYKTNKNPFKSHYFNALDGVSLSLKMGENLGIVGMSGSGKSTLAKALLQLCPYEGSVEFMGKNLRNIAQKELKSLRANLQVVFQDPFSSLNPRMSVYSIVAEGLMVHKTLTKEQIKAEVEKTLNLVGLFNISHKFPHEFSGGERQRIAIARAIILKPKLIILDEPTSSLDKNIALKIIELLQNLQKELSLTYIIISHDLGVIKALSQKTIVLKNGKIIEQNQTQKILSTPQDPYTQNLINASFSF